jgi:hypothetical protein
MMSLKWQSTSVRANIPALNLGYWGVYEDLRLNGLRGTTSLPATATRRGAKLKLTPQLTRC